MNSLNQSHKKIEEQIKELFRTGSTNKPYQSAHVQFSDSKYSNRLTEDVIIELVLEAFKEIESEQERKLKLFLKKREFLCNCTRSYAVRTKEIEEYYELRGETNESEE